MRRGIRLAVAAVAMMGVLVACGDDEGGGGGGDADPQASQRLEAQRDDVRRVALQVAPALADSLTGSSLTFLRGSWTGCTSADEWTYRDFKYRVAGRIDATDLSTESLSTLQRVLADEGFEVSAEDDKAGLNGVRDDLATGLTVYPDDGFVLISFAGQCVEVPEDEREAWAQRGEPDKNLVPPAAQEGR